MNKNTLNISLILIFVLAFIGFNSLYVVTEGTKGIVTRFGKVVRDSEGKLQIVDPGLHLKAPFIDQVKALDVKIQTISSSADRFVTSEKKDVIIDSYVKWQILDAATYYLTTAGGNKMQAEELLRRRINNSLRSQIGRLTIHQIVSGQNSGKNQATEEENVFDSSDSEVVAVASQRMRAERDAVAKLHRSQGRKEAEAIKAHADREVVVKIAEAERQARTLRGEGDAEATRIYAQAYKQNPQLFEFLRSMDAYKKSMASGKDVLVLKPDSEFFKYFNDANGAKGTN